MDVHQGLGDSHAKTQPSVPVDVGTLFERLKEAAQYLRAHPNTIIPERKNDSSLCIIRTGNGNVASALSELGGIVQDIAKYLLQARRIAFDVVSRSVQIDGQAQMFRIDLTSEHCDHC